MNSYQKSLLRENSSAVAYASLEFNEDGEFVPTENRLFCGLYIAPSSSGNIKIEGVDGASVTLSLTSGYWPLGGAKIIEDGTTITPSAVTVLF
jgi:hypothetical protein